MQKVIVVLSLDITSDDEVPITDDEIAECLKRELNGDFCINDNLDVWIRVSVRTMSI